MNIQFLVRYAFDCLMVNWGAIFYLYFNFLNLRGFKHAFKLLRGDFAKPGNEGELSHFQALSTAVSGTVELEILLEWQLLFL